MIVHPHTARAVTILLALTAFVSACGSSIEPGDAGASMDAGIDEMRDDAARRDAGDEQHRDGGEQHRECRENGARCPGGICRDGDCVPSLCGDGFVDERNGEECDDGNDTPRDGCEPATCLRTRCATAEDCSDGDGCNGEEVCDSGSGACSRGTPLEVGDPCTSEAVSEGVCELPGDVLTCVPETCGNGVIDGDEQCDDGNEAADDGCRPNCTFTCTADASCTDRDACTGTERCDLETHRCTAGIALDCSDRNACTMDTCNRLLGCRNSLIDADGDGHAPSSLGVCGGDCDDSRADVHPDMGELCDGLDHDCDGVPSDSTPPTWYRDCDEDDYAPLEVLDDATAVRVSCTEPAVVAGCGWTTRRPRETGLLSRDCDDEDDDIKPRATEIAGDEIDQNCDGEELCYADLDNDNTRATDGDTLTSADTDCDDSTEAPATQPATDCCNTDADVHVGQTAYFEDTTACGGWDYNCDAVDTRFYTGTNIATACPSGSDCLLADDVVGWLGGAQPTCGNSRSWQSACDFEGGAGGGTCDQVTMLRTQSCR